MKRFSLEKLFEYFLFVFVFLLPWQTRWIIKAGQINGGVNEYLTYSLYGTDILLVLLLVVYAVNFIKHKIQNTKTQKELCSVFLGLVIVIFVSIFFSQDKLLALFTFFRLLLGVALIYLVINFQDKAKLIFWFLLGLVLPSWLAVWQFLSQSTFANKWLGLALHIPSEGGTSVIEFQTVGQLPERWLRAYGSFDHPNILGGALAIGLIWGIYLLVGWYEEKKLEKQRLVLYLVISSLAAGCFVSFSRGAWLGLVVGLFVFLISLIYQKKYSQIKAWCLGVCMILVIFLFFLLPYHSLVGVRLGGEARLERKSTTERIASYSEAWQLIKANTLTGVGSGNYTSALSKAIPKQPSYFYQPTHNVFLLIFSEMGLFGFLFSISLALVVLWKLFKKRSFIGVSIFLSLIIMMQVDHWFMSLHFGILFVSLVFGLVSQDFFQKNNS